MFVITDCTINPVKKYSSNDCKDVADIILGTTEDARITQKALWKVSGMQFGGVLVANPYYTIGCINEN